MTEDTALTPTLIAALAPLGDTPNDRNPALVYLAGLAKGSRRTMLDALNTIAQISTGGMRGADGKWHGGTADALTMPWGLLRFQHTTAIRSRLADEYEPATANKMLSALRGVLEACWRLGQMNAEDYHRARDVKNVRGQTVPAGRELTGGELGALMGACAADDSLSGVRDAAIIAVMYAGGLRRDEVVSLQVEDYNATTGRLVIQGKGHKERTTYLNNGAADALADWLAARGSEAGALFPPVNKGGIADNRPMTAQAIYNLLQKRAQEAGVKSFSPHDLRRTFVSDLLDAGADIATVAKMAGHANVQTTARYDRRPEEAKRKAAGLLHVPYSPRSNAK